MKKHLTQASLEGAIRRIFGDENVRREVGTGDGSRRRFDMLVRHRGHVLAIEYDGHRHYCDPNAIASDRAKARAARAGGIALIRWPYFVQMTGQTLLYYLGNALPAGTPDYPQTYPHGFIDPSCVVPGGFCPAGRNRYDLEVQGLPTNIRDDIAQSLARWIERTGSDIDLVL